MAKVAKVHMEVVTPGRGATGSVQEKNFKSPTKSLQHVLFDYSKSNNNKNLFMENVEKLNQYIDVSGSIRHDAPTVVYSVRKLTDPVFEAPAKPENN